MIMTNAMCKLFVEQVNQMLNKGVDIVEFYSANKNNSVCNPLKYDDYIGYTDQFEWDRNIEIDEIKKELRDYSNFAYKVMSKKNMSSGCLETTINSLLIYLVRSLGFLSYINNRRLIM